MFAIVSASYNAWADARLIDFLRSIERPEKIDKILAHLALAGETWLARLDGGTPPSSIWAELTFEDAVSRLDAVDERLLTPRDPGVRVHYASLDGTPFDNTVEEILAHVCNHATYHRGQIAGLLLGADLEPPIMDYIAYLRRI